MRQNWASDGSNLVLEGDNLALLPSFPDEAFQMIYIDPPFNTGQRQEGRRSRAKRANEDDGVEGFQGQRYVRETRVTTTYSDTFADYQAFLRPRLIEARRLLVASGTLYVHLDYREAHYTKIMLDEIFGRGCFLNEVIWAYDYGAKSKRRWPTKHDTILVYVKDSRNYWFDSDSVDREPYMAPGLVTPEKAARGKLPTDVWWHTIVPTQGAERTGYPTQKPLGILRRAIAASSRKGDWVLDFFAGSGSTGAAAASLGRRFVLIDSNPDAIKVIQQRLTKLGVPYE
jgi:site-specific DNA-methyltransferase (adenine-specific)